MKLEKLFPQEKPLTREQMLSLNGGYALPTSTNEGAHNTEVGSSIVTDWDYLDAD